MTDRDTRAFEAFLFEAKSYWMGTIFPALRAEYETAAAGRGVETPEAAGALLEGTPTYQYFAWLERHMQREKYSGRHGLLASHEAQRGPLEARLEDAATPALLTLDPDVEIPAYYSDIDTHQHPGNLHGDSLAGLVYKASAGSTQPGQTAGYALHERFAKVVEGHGAFRRVLDAGCGFGKSTITLAERFPEASVEGADLAVPCLKLAALEAGEKQMRNLRYREADVCKTAYADGSFDLVTSTMLLHELDPGAVQDFLRESHRLLQPGGMVIHLDFQVSDPFLKFLHHEHGKRNNEPYMEAFDRLDVTRALTDAGFTDPATSVFAETDTVTGERHDTWRFPWTLITARKPQ